MNGSSDGTAPSSARPRVATRQAETPRNSGGRDWSTSLNLVRGAAESVKAAEGQTYQVIARAELILQRASQELEAAHERIAEAERRMQAAETRAGQAEAMIREIEARAQLAEARAGQAEQWLERIHEAIVSEFPQTLSHEPLHAAREATSLLEVA
jgi:chromosome segregation ATPase